MKSVYFLIIFVFLFGNAYTQNEEIENRVDSMTYQLYLNAEWAELIHTSNEALNIPIDFYYLRIRLGLAYFYTNDFINAAKQFEIAQNKQELNQYIIEHLYLSYMYVGDYAKAYEYFKKLSSDEKKSLGISEKYLLNKLEFNTMFISNDKKFNNDYDFTINEDIYADASTTKYAYGGNFDYLHMFKSYKFGIKGGVNYQMFRMVNNYRFPEISTSQINKNKTKEINKSFEHNLNQFVYNLAIPIYINKSTLFEARVSYLDVNFDITKVDTNQLFILNRMTNFYEPKVSYNFSDTNLNENNYLVSIALTKKIHKIKFIANSSLSNFNDQNQLQTGINLWYFPKGNLNFYCNVGTFVQSIITKPKPNSPMGKGKGKDQNQPLQISENNLVYNIGFGFKVFDKLWLENYFHYGKIKDYQEQNGLFIYNSAFYEYWKSKLKLMYIVNKNFSINISGELFKKELNYINFKNEIPFPIMDFQKVKFNEYLINGGIKWNF